MFMALFPLLTGVEVTRRRSLRLLKQGAQKKGPRQGMLNMSDTPEINVGPRADGRGRYCLSSQSPDLPLPHGLAPFRDHGLRPPLSTENPTNKGFSGSGAPILGFGLADPATKG